MIKLILAIYLFLFPRCELMVSFLHDADFEHCNDSDEWRKHCYAASDWDYGGAPVAWLRDDGPLMHFVLHLPYVRTVSCWR